MNESRVEKLIEAKKRIVFCTYSSVYSSIVLKRLLADEGVKGGVEVVAIINSTRVINPKYGFFRGAIAQIKTSGWRYSSYLFMVTDLFAAIKPAKTIHGIAKEYDIPLLDTPDINTPEILAFIESKQANTLLAAHFNQLIKNPLLHFFDKQCLNIHPSLLPAFKGVDPTFFAMLDNQPLGVSLHEMSETFDTGDILLQQCCVVDSSDTVFSANCKLFDTGAKLALGELHNPAKNKKDINKAGNYDSWPTRRQVSQLRQAGKRLIRLSQFLKKLVNMNKIKSKGSEA